MRYKTKWDEVLNLVEHSPLPAAGQDVFLFGGTLYGILAIPILKNEMHLIALCDNDKRKQGTKIESLPCVSPQVLKQYKNPFVLVSSCKHYQSIHEELSIMNIPHCSLDAYVIRRNLDAFQEVYRSLDDESKRIYAGVLYCHLLGSEADVEEYCSDHQYFCFPQFRYIGMRDTYVDCGAFTGDIVQRVAENSVGLFRKIYAFEPSPRAYAAMQKRVSLINDIWALEEGQIVCEQKGVGAKSSHAFFRTNAANLANMSVSVADDSPGNVEIVALDDYLAQHNVEKVDFIKSDIEGFEWDMLHGAARTIQRDKPKLAISIYHSIFDFFRIHQYLKELVPEYTFAVRHHWNSFDETVLYGYIKQEGQKWGMN